MRRTVDAVVTGIGPTGTSIGHEVARKVLAVMVVRRQSRVAGLAGGLSTFCGPGGRDRGPAPGRAEPEDSIAPDLEPQIPGSLVGHRRAFVERDSTPCWRNATVVTAIHDVTVHRRYPIGGWTELRGWQVAIAMCGRRLEIARTTAWSLRAPAPGVGATRDHDPLVVTPRRTCKPFDVGLLSRHPGAIRSPVVGSGSAGGPMRSGSVLRRALR